MSAAGASKAPMVARQKKVRVAANERIARDTYRLSLEDPETAGTILPGQFVMIRGAAGNEPLLGRPFALYDVARDDSGTPVEVVIVYQVVGKGTSWLATRRPGDEVSVWGPLGNGFPGSPGGRVVAVAGGIGQTPFLALGRWWRKLDRYGRNGAGPSIEAMHLLYGVRTADYLAGLDDFQQAGIEVEVATDDGSAGHPGFVTELLRRRLAGFPPPTLVVGCGPPAMLAALARILREQAVPGLLSLENHMACGFGACFSCVAPIREVDGTIDLKRVCVEGPIFDVRAVSFA